MYVADRRVQDTLSVHAVLNWLKPLANRYLVNIHLRLCYQRLSKRSRHIYIRQKRKPSSLSAWRVGLRTLARLADTFMSDRVGAASFVSFRGLSSLLKTLRTTVRAMMYIVRRA